MTVDKTKILFKPKTYTKEEIELKYPNFSYGKSTVEKVFISIENHFGALASLNIATSDGFVYGGKNNTSTLGFLLRYFSDFFFLPYDRLDRSFIEDLVGEEIQYFWNDKNRFVFIGNQKGEFIWIDDTQYLKYSQAEGERLKEIDDRESI